jgi:hypothetical protein
VRQDEDPLLNNAQCISDKGFIAQAEQSGMKSRKK